MTTAPGPYPYQLEGIEFLRARPRALLADDPGLGKSLQALMAAEGRTLVVAPAMVVDGGVWSVEREKWRPDLDLTQVSYHRLRDRDGRKWLDKLAPELDHQWDTVIFDEAHYLKERKTTWTKAGERAAKQADRVFLLTGTPIPSWAYEAFMLLRILHPGDRRFTSYWRFVEEWFVVGRNRFTAYSVSGDLLACDVRCDGRPASDPCRHWREFYAATFGDLMLRRLRDDVLTDLPPLTRQVVECPMTTAQRAAYVKLKRDFIAWVEETGNERLVWSSAAQYVGLMQATTGLPSLDPEAKTGSGKLDALAGLLEGRGHPSLVLAYYRNTAAAIERLCERLGLRHATLGASASRSQRKATVEAFQAGHLDVLVGSIGVVAEGLTLTRADTVVFVERHPVPSRNEQASRRVHRIGQTRPVTLIELRTPDSLDEGMTRLLDGKTDNAARALAPSQIAALA